MDYLSKMDMVQVHAFYSIYKQNIRLGSSNEQAFADAIEATSDEVFEKADPKLVEEYLAIMKEKSRAQI